MRQNQTITLILVILAAVLALIGLTWVNYRFTQQNPGGNDFLARWVGANAWVMDGVSPYDESVSLETQRRIYGRPATADEDTSHFVYPLHSMIFFAPFGVMDYEWARPLWMTLLELAIVGLVVVSVRLVEWEKLSPWKLVLFALFAVFWYHGARTLILGQFAALNAFLIALGLLFVKQKQDVAAGIMFALATSKPPMVYLLIPYVVIWGLSARRTQLVAATVGGVVLLLGISQLILPGWWLDWLRQLSDYPTYTATISPVAIIANAVPGIRETVNGTLTVMVVLYMLMEWWFSFGKDERHFFWTACMTMVLSMMIAPRTATTNYLMFFPGLILILQIVEDRWARGGKAFVWIALGGLLIGLWALFFATVNGNAESLAMYMPLPFLMLFGLWWVRWWAIRPSRLLLEDFAARMG